MTIDPSIFKMYDIRGIYPETVNENIAYKVARAYSEILKRENPNKELKIVVGNDMRLSSPSIKERIIKGLVDSGLNVVDIGLVTTPTFYFGVAYYDHDGGIQISASHNPPKYNGFKMTRAGAVPVSGESGIDEIKDMVIKGKFPEVKEKGTVTKRENIVDEEVRVQREGIGWQKIKSFKVVVDTGNGMGALDVKAIFADLPCKLVKLNFNLDGNFPVHVPDPLKEENLRWVKESVVKEKADIGIAIDGDGDRWFFVDEKGETVDQPILRGLMAQIELKENPGATVCYDIRPGRITKDMIEEAGDRAVVTKVGHSLIKETMIKENAIFGGESSGHYFYKFDYGTFEAPVVLVLKFLLYISEQNKPLSEILQPYKKYYNSGEINSEVEDKKGKIKEVAEKYKDSKISYLDGVTLEYADFWFNVRLSNTEDLLRL
ncbi:phosphomannomutase/phosphoglucomutase, partial [Patescibacteria group bacterium]|nr:phosphomannomutase/phosphoglucomutase [Patescibacteria group bacterium]